MKVVIILSTLFFVFTFSAQAQTELIRHKSHSGTNKTFNPNKLNGNFGLRVSEGEIREDKSSSYKLLYSHIGSSYTYYLFYTEREDMKLNVCLEKDKVLETVKVSAYDDTDATEKRLTQKLLKLRKKEKRSKVMRWRKRK